MHQNVTEELQFKSIVETSHDVIMRFDRAHRHLYVNKAVEAQTGIAPEDFIGKTHEELGFPPYLCEIWDDAIDFVFKNWLLLLILMKSIKMGKLYKSFWF